MSLICSPVLLPRVLDVGQEPHRQSHNSLFFFSPSHRLGTCQIYLTSVTSIWTLLLVSDDPIGHLRSINVCV